MPKGGLRIGAGRKPRPKGVVIGMDGVRREVAAPLGPAPVTPAEAASLLEPPAGLAESAAATWRELAPHAIAQQTLVPATRQGFRELVEQLGMKQAVADAINNAGAATSGMDALLRHYARLAQRLDASLARFRLTAAGRPEPSAAQQKPKTASPWAVAR